MSGRFAVTLPVASIVIEGCVRCLIDSQDEEGASINPSVFDFSYAEAAPAEAHFPEEELLSSGQVLSPASRLPEEDALKKFLMIGALAFTATTFAQTAMAAEYYVVRDTATKKCTIVETKPTATTTTIVDNGVFKTKTEAETGMKTMKVCTSE